MMAGTADGVADHEQPTDIYMDGTCDLVKSDTGGAPLGPRQYRAIATDVIATFH